MRVAVRGCLCKHGLCVQGSVGVRHGWLGSDFDTGEYMIARPDRSPGLTATATTRIHFGLRPNVKRPSPVSRRELSIDVRAGAHRRSEVNSVGLKAARKQGVLERSFTRVLHSRELGCRDTAGAPAARR